jgi:ParB-like chromosome segregation protein Spo0J
MLALNLAENIQRASINAIERARAFKRLMQLEDLTATEVAVRMSLSNATVSNTLALLDLPESLQARVAAGDLPATVAVHIARVGDDATRRALADQYDAGSLNRSGVAAEVNRLLKPGRKKAAKPSRLACRVDGVGISLTAKTPLQWDSLLYAITRLHNEAERLREENKPVTDLARVLRAS